jgi:hypothetical protein
MEGPAKGQRPEGSQKREATGRGAAEEKKKKKKKKPGPVEIQTPVWQALGCLSWLRDIALAETASPSPAVVEFFATVRAVVLRAVGEE